MNDYKMIDIATYFENQENFFPFLTGKIKEKHCQFELLKKFGREYLYYSHLEILGKKYVIF